MAGQLAALPHDPTNGVGGHSLSRLCPLTPLIGARDGGSASSVSAFALVRAYAGIAFGGPVFLEQRSDFLHEAQPIRGHKRPVVFLNFCLL